MIDVLCPILGRPPHAMLRSLEHATTSSFQVYFICSPGDDTYELCKQTGRPTFLMEWESGRADFAKKINWMFERTARPWCFTAGDDLRFHPGWDIAAITAGTRVVGTNDLHSPAVQTGKFATHMLFARSYIEECGGTFDNSDPVFWEGYDHQFVDNEFNEKAKTLREWSFARESVVEHLHPVWGKAEWDPTYNKAFRETQQDQALYASRLKAFRKSQKRDIVGAR
jgi:hypothetical protein